MPKYTNNSRQVVTLTTGAKDEKTGLAQTRDFRPGESGSLSEAEINFSPRNRGLVDAFLTAESGSAAPARSAKAE